MGQRCSTWIFGPRSIVDVMADLNDYPWPIASGWAEYIYLTDIYEHLREAYLPIEECWRILQPEAGCSFSTSYWKSENSYTCPDHLRFCTLHTMDFWDNARPLDKIRIFSARPGLRSSQQRSAAKSWHLPYVRKPLDDGSWDLKSRYPRRRY